jgi:uncharacterized phage-associated protein
MAYDPNQIAEWFIQRAKSEGEYLTQMKLQKLVYIAHGWRLGLYHKPLIRGEFEAWQWGPVIRPLYATYAKFGSKPIVLKASRETAINDPTVRKLLEKVWRSYRRYTAAQLSDMTHKSGTPWHQTYRDGIKREIPNDLIERHYEEMAAD